MKFKKVDFSSDLLASYSENRKCYEKILNTKVRPFKELYQMQKRFCKNIENWRSYGGKSKKVPLRLCDATLQDFEK